MQRITGSSTPAPSPVAEGDTSGAALSTQTSPAARPGSPRLQNHSPLQGLQRPGLGAPESVNRSAFSAATAVAAATATATPGVTATALGPPMDFFPKVDQWAADPACGAERLDRRRAAERIKDAFDDQSYDLNLGFMHLTSLPSCMSYMTELRELNISNNQIAVSGGLPPNIQILHAQNNLLEQLPRLPALTHLYIDGNQLAQLPESNDRLVRASLTRNRFEDLVGLPATLQTLEAEPELIAASLVHLQANLETQTARLAAHANENPLELPGDLARLDPALSESVLAYLAPGDPALQSLSHTDTATHRQLEERAVINKEIAATNAQIAMFQRFQ